LIKYLAYNIIITPYVIPLKSHSLINYIVLLQKNIKMKRVNFRGRVEGEACRKI
jgi:hypothetical protein